MQRWYSTTKFVAAFAAWSCCALIMALIASPVFAQSGAYGVAPANPLRGDALPIAVSSTKRTGGNASLVQQAQATEPLPSPLRQAPAEPELSPLPDQQPRGDGSVLMQGPPPYGLQYGETDPSLAWPADAPAHHQWGLHQRPRHHGQHAYPPREPWFANNTPDDPDRHSGWGDPLTGTSWLNRPWYVGAFVGGMLADDLADDVGADSAPFLGLRLGNDFDHYWGWEIRYAYARVEAFTGAGVPIAEPGREYYVDVALLHYPWGDSRWRPYLLAGVGFMNARYVNGAGQGIDDTALTIPLGVGLKLYNSPWFTIRFDAVDNLSFGGGHLDSMHNFSLMLGAEVRFGGTRPSYFPWTGNTSYW